MARYIQCPKTHKLIPADEYVRPVERHHMIMADVEPFQSPVDKSLITTRPQLREHNRRHGVTNFADYPPEYVSKRAKAKLAQQQREGKAHRKDLIQKALYQMERGSYE